MKTGSTKLRQGPGTPATCKAWEAGIKWGAIMNHSLGMTDSQGPISVGDSFHREKGKKKESKEKPVQTGTLWLAGG